MTTSSSYGAMEDMPTSRRSLLVGTNNKPSSSSLRYQQRGSQRPVLKTIISRRRLMTNSINSSNVAVKRKSFVYTMLVSTFIVFEINLPPTKLMNNLIDQIVPSSYNIEYLHYLIYFSSSSPESKINCMAGSCL
jgi:hypothetical protein